MTSTNTYTPYFYIIRHIPTSKLYAGSRYAKNCHPSEFMTVNGYTTSSPTINDLIKENGLTVFEILRIDTNCDGLHPHDYESLFLQTLNCAASDLWFNAHNNNGNFALGTAGYYKIMMQKYNVTNPMQSAKIKEKIKQYYITNFNVENPLQIESVREKHKATCLKRYGYEFPQQCPELISKSNQTKANKSEEEKQKFYKLCADVKSNYWKISKFNGEIIQIKNLKSFCVDNNISYHAAKESNKMNTVATHKSCNGWQFNKL